VQPERVLIVAFERKNISYQFNDEAKAAMIMVLEQFDEHLETVHELKNMLMVDGAIVLDSHFAVLLARLIAPHYSAWSEKLLAPIETFPALTTNQHQARYFQLVNRTT
jgi:hypothetical protein